jgi:chorismate--pyruvate lyase
MRSSPHRDPWLQHLPHSSGCGDFYDWLVHVGSLTARIRSRCSDFRVRLVAQGRRVPFGDEMAPLGLRAGESAWVREVVLLCGDAPLVFAHTVLPAANACGPWRLLAGLGTKPLGELLFTDPLISRAALRYARLDRRYSMHARATEVCGVLAGTLWARRSLFSRDGRAILVSEVFLPEILSLPT